MANECYKHKMDLITNGVVIDDALKFVENNRPSKDKPASVEMENSQDYPTENNIVI